MSLPKGHQLRSSPRQIRNRPSLVPTARKGRSEQSPPTRYAQSPRRARLARSDRTGSIPRSWLPPSQLARSRQSSERLRRETRFSSAGLLRPCAIHLFTERESCHVAGILAQVAIHLPQEHAGVSIPTDIILRSCREKSWT